MKLTAVHNNGIYYEIPTGLMHKKYRGCGNGYLLVRVTDDKVIDFGYLDENDKEITEQNIQMHPNAGEVLLVADHYTKYRANFSCGHACLF